MKRERDLKETAEEWLEFADRTEVVLGPGKTEVINSLVRERISNPMNKKLDKKCQCGVESVGGGMHSEWCPKGE